VEQAVIAAVAVHSFVLGFVLLYCPRWLLVNLGWNYEGPWFFPHQAGIFLILLSWAYLAGIWRTEFAWFLVASKATAVVFLLAECAAGGAPPVLLLAALFDGLMGAAVAAAIIWRILAQRTGKATETFSDSSRKKG
jgi:hypothetical protein